MLLITKYAEQSVEEKGKKNAFGSFYFKLNSLQTLISQHNYFCFLHSCLSPLPFWVPYITISSLILVVLHWGEVQINTSHKTTQLDPDCSVITKSLAWSKSKANAVWLMGGLGSSKTDIMLIVQYVTGKSQ